MSCLAGSSLQKVVAGLNKIEIAIVCCIIGYGFIAAFSIAMGNACLDLAAIFACIRIFSSKKEMSVDRKIVTLFVMFFGSLLISIFFAYQPELSWQPLWRLFYYMVPPFFLGSLFIHTQLQRWALVLAMTTGGLMSSLYAFWQAGQGISRATGFVNMLELAGQLSMLIPILVVILLCSCKKNQLKWFYGAAFFIAGVALLLNGTRGAWVSVFIVSFGYLAMICYRNVKVVSWSKFIFALLLSISLCSLIATHIPELKSRIVSVINFQDRNLGARLAMWSSASAMILDHPVLGVGLGNYHEQYKTKYARDDLTVKYTGSLYSSWLDHRHPHNSFLHLLSETGMLGFGTFLSLYFYVLFHHGLRLKTNMNFSVWSHATFLVTCVFLLFGMSENVLYGMNQYTQVLWLFIGATWFKAPYKES